MTLSFKYPGVYVREIPSEVRTITGVATSVTAFIGRTRRGPTDRPVLVQSFGEFAAIYGGMWDQSPLTYAVSQYFLNGGRDALICRVHKSAQTASVTLPNSFGLKAANEGSWGSKLRVRVEGAPHDSADPPNSRFNLLVRDTDTKQTEAFLNLSVVDTHPRFVLKVLEAESALVRISGSVPNAAPTASNTPNPLPADPLEDASTSTGFQSDGSDGVDITANEVADPGLEALQRGMYLLDLADIVNLICVPPPTREGDWDQNLWDAVATYAEARRAIVLVDPKTSWANPDAARDGLQTWVSTTANGAIYYPRIMAADPLRENRIDTFAPCGAVAGVIARTDATRGVWKAPAGLDATLVGVSALKYTLDDGKNGRLNPRGINCLRQFPATGRVVWGARTLKGDDQLANEWKYLPVRRTALYIEESLYRGLKWVVFEPNDEPLWSQIRLNVGAFMHDMFRQGAFQGLTPNKAYFVKCDNESTTQSDINNGIVNIVVGFAPLKPAEFVVISLKQMAGQIAT
ncbi:phage tail sheath family protein [Mycobacterium sp. C3-094]